MRTFKFKTPIHVARDGTAVHQEVEYSSEEDFPVFQEEVVEMLCLVGILQRAKGKEDHDKILEEIAKSMCVPKCVLTGEPPLNGACETLANAEKIKESAQKQFAQGVMPEPSLSEKIQDDITKNTPDSSLA